MLERSLHKSASVNFFVYGNIKKKDAEHTVVLLSSSEENVMANSILNALIVTFYLLEIILVHTSTKVAHPYQRKLHKWHQQKNGKMYY